MITKVVFLLIALTAVSTFQELRISPPIEVLYDHITNTWQTGCTDGVPTEALSDGHAVVDSSSGIRGRKYILGSVRMISVATLGLASPPDAGNRATSVEIANPNPPKE